MGRDAVRIVAQNKKVWHDYIVEETLEAGIVLVGTEVKSIRMSKVNLKDSYIVIKKGEAFLYNMHISPYEKGNIFNKDPMRTRKLLLHKKEISRLVGYVQQKGMTLVPIKVYFKRCRVKIEVGIAKGKKTYDKRQDIAKRDAKREIERKLKESYK
jgi:SsrA-binding protein